MLAGVVLLVNLPSPPLEVFSMAKTILLRRGGTRRSPYIKPLTAQSRMAKWQTCSKQPHDSMALSFLLERTFMPIKRLDRN